MESIKQIYRIGHGPSSSHTMGPMRAARMFLERNRGAVRFNVTLYGSLAATGKGHMTDAAILEVLSPVAKTNITWEPKVFLPFHPNGILFQSFDESGEGGFNSVYINKEAHVKEFAISTANGLVYVLDLSLIHISEPTRP